MWFRRALLAISFLFLISSIVVATLLTKGMIPTSNSGGFILLSMSMSCAFVAFGWWISLQLAQRQNTVAVIMQSRLSEAFNKRLEIYVRTFPNALVIAREHVSNEQYAEAIDAVKYVLNYHEFICSAMARGEISERLCRAFFGFIYPSLYIKAKHVIDACRESNGSAFAELEHYAIKWGGDKLQHKE